MRNPLGLVVLAFLTALALPTLASTPIAGAAAASALRFQRLRLDNGLEVLLHPTPGAPMVGVFGVVRAGSVHERPGEEGLSHLLEHLLFNGTARMTQEQLYAAFDAMGGYANATTRHDHTVFQTLVLRRHLGEALALLGDMLFRSTIPADKLDKERGIVLEEIAKDAANRDSAAEERFRAWAWAGTPLARPVIGSAATLGAIGRERVVEYWQRRYVPANVTLLVLGELSRDELARAIESANLAAVRPAAPPERDAAATLELATAELRTEPAEQERVELALLFSGPDPGHPDAWALDVLAGILTRGPGLSLEKALAGAGFAGGGSAWLERAGGATGFQLRAHAPAGTSPRALLDAALAAIAEAAAAGETELDALHTRLLVEDALLAEKPHYFGIEKAALLANGGPGAVEGEGPALAAVTRATLAAAAGRWLRDRPYRALVSGPGLSAGTTPIAAGTTGTRAAAGSSRRVVRRRLGPGLEVVVAASAASQVFAAHALLAGHCGLDELVQRLRLRRGPDLDRDLKAMGAEVKTFDSPQLPFDDYYDVPDYSYVRLETADVFAGPAVAALGRLLAPPQPGEDELRAARAELGDLLGREAKSAAAHSARRLAESLYGPGSALSCPHHGETAEIEAATPAAVTAHARARLASAPVVIAIETGLDPETVMGWLAPVARDLGLAGEAAPRAFPKLADLPAACAPVRETLGGPQGYVRLGATARPSDRAAFVLAAAVLSERLQAEIREKRGQSYSIGAGATLRWEGLPDAWTASAGTRPENVEAVETGMLDVLAALRRDGPSADEVRRAASRLAGRDLMRRLTSIGRAWQASLDVARAADPEWSRALIESLASVPAERVTASLARDFDPRRACVVAVR